jgi:NHL repeat
MAAEPSRVRAELDRVGTGFRKAGSADYIAVTEDEDVVRVVGPPQEHPRRYWKRPAQTQNLFVANQTINTIREFSPNGVDLGDFATTGLSSPAGLAFDKAGNLYVSNRGDGTIRKFSRSGADLGYFATTGMVTPVGLAFSPEAENENGDG